MSFHNPAEIPETLPDRLVMQLHWYREPNFQSLLREHGFKIIVLSRHPLDVLVSSLHFIRREPATARWLEGNAELPGDLLESSPTSALFVDYAVSWGAENLLSVSYQWQFERAAVNVSYETLVSDPPAAFASISRQLGGTLERLDEAIKASRFEVFRNLPNHHGWQGRPGIWRELVLHADAARIMRRHQRVFDTLGYRVPFYLLSRRRAQANWARVAP